MGYSIRAYPYQLAEAVAGTRYLDWQFALTQNPEGAAAETMTQGFGYPVTSGTNLASWQVMLFPPQYLSVALRSPDSGNHERVLRFVHTFLVPSPDFAGEWDRWVLQCILSVHAHEAMEEFTVNGVKEFYPAHGDEGSPYDVIRRSDRKKLCTVPLRQPSIQGLRL